MNINMRDVMNKYLVNFRVESNRRMSMIGQIPDDIPFYIYDGAHEAAKDATISQLNIMDDETKNKMDDVFNYFMKLFKENEHYADTDDLVVKAIGEGKFD